MEPKSPAGVIDFIGSQEHSANKILIEGKVFDNDGRGKGYIIKGCHQLLHYTKQYNEDKSYLVIFNITNKHLVFNIDKDAIGFPFLVLDNRAMYVMVIDVFVHESPASVRPIESPVEINISDLKPVG